MLIAPQQVKTKPLIIIIINFMCTFVGRDINFDAILMVAFICGIVVCAQCPIAPRYAL